MPNVLAKKDVKTGLKMITAREQLEHLHERRAEPPGREIRPRQRSRRFGSSSAVFTMPGSRLSEGPLVHVLKVRAKRLREGDQIVVTVGRVMGMQGRKPRDGAPLMRIELDDGTSWSLREDVQLRVLRET